MNTECGIPFSNSLLHPKYWATWLGMGVVFILSFFPQSLRHKIGRRIGKSIHNNNKKRRNTSLKNIQIAFPHLSDEELNAIALKQLQHYGCALIDYSLLFFASKKRLLSLLIMEGKEHIDKALAENKSIIILLPHSSYLDFSPIALGAHYTIFGSYKTSKNPVVDWMIARSRCRHAEFLVSRNEGLRKLIRSIQPGKLMVFLPDEDLGAENAVFAPFFGMPKATLSTTARMAKMAKAVTIPIFSYFNEGSGKYHVKISPPLENYPSGDAIQDATTMNQSLEALISEHPEQYMWFLKWFNTRPEGDTFKY